MAGGPGTSSRGRGGKFKKYTRGGGKHFSRDIRPTDAEGNEVSMWAVGGKKKGDDDEDDSDETEDSEEDSDEDEEDSDDEPGPSKAPVQDTSREDRKAEKKARKEAAIAKSQARTVEVGDLPSSDEDSDEDSDDDDMPANPNHSKASRDMTKAPAKDVDEITEGVANINAAPASRREREAIEAAAAKERFMRLTAQGKTDESKADLARLKLIREQREAEAARRKAEKEEKDEEEKAKRAQIEEREARKKASAPKPSKKKK